MKQTRFNVKVIDKGKMEQFIFDFNRIEEKAHYLDKLQREIDGRQLQWNSEYQQLWGEINTLKSKLKV